MRLFGPPNVEKMKAKDDIKGLIKALGYQKNPEVCQSASLALVDIGALAVEPLISAFGNDAVRQAAIETLVKIGEPSIGPLIDALMQYPSYASAIEALDKIGEPAVALAVERYTVSLAAASNNDIVEQVRVLTKIGAPAVERLVVILTDRQVTKVCKIPNMMVILRAETEAIIPHLRDRVKDFTELNDYGFHLRGIIAGALGMIRDNRAVEALIVTLQDKDKFVRWAAAGALFQIGDDRAIRSLITNLQDDDLLVSGADDVWALTGDGQTVKPLLVDLVAPGSQSRIATSETLNKLGWKAQLFHRA